MSIVSAAKAAPAPPTTAARRRRLGVPAALVPVLSVCALLLVWQLVSARFFPPVLFPTPVMVGTALVGAILSGRLLTDSVVSLRRTAGFVLHHRPGLGLRDPCGWRGATRPFIQFGRFVPSISPSPRSSVRHREAEAFLITYTMTSLPFTNTLGAVLVPRGTRSGRHRARATRQQISARHAAREPSWHLHRTRVAWGCRSRRWSRPR
jgi:hypothetical protein